MEVTPGATAFVDATKMYEALLEEDKAWVDVSTVQYAGWPYGWMSKCKALSNGLGLISEGLELPLDKLPPIDPDKVQNLPMRWSRSLPSPERRP